MNRIDKEIKWVKEGEKAITDEKFKLKMEAQIAANLNLNAEAIKAMRHVMDQREEILQAFVAKHGFDPDECVQIQFQTKEGSFGWCVRKKEKGEP